MNAKWKFTRILGLTCCVGMLGAGMVAMAATGQPKGLKKVALGTVALADQAEARSNVDAPVAIDTQLTILKFAQTETGVSLQLAQTDTQPTTRSAQPGTRTASSTVGCPAGTCDADAGVAMTQSLDAQTGGGPNIACAGEGLTTPNAWARCYNLPNEGIFGDLTVDSVTFGVAQATIDGINVDVNLYISTVGCPDIVGVADVALLATASITVNNSDEGSLLTVNFPANTVVAAGSDLVVEISSPDDGIAEGFAFRAMHNAFGQCGLSYLRADLCGAPDWTDIGLFGFPEAALVQVVNGTTDLCGVPPCPATTCEGDSATVTQSLSTLIQGNVACAAADVGTTENSWARCFDLGAEDITSDLTIDSVTFGVLQATIDGINVIVSVYTDSDGCPPPEDNGPSDPTLTLIGSTSTTVGPDDEGTLITLDFNPPLVVSGCSALIVDVETPDDGTEEPLFFFRAAANGDLNVCGEDGLCTITGEVCTTDDDCPDIDVGECGPSYLRAAPCGFAGWVNESDIGFPDEHLVLILNGSSACGEGECLFCGDGNCDPEENCDNCASDCGECCGDGVCGGDDPSENCDTCVEDCDGPCVCGNGEREGFEECDGDDDDGCLSGCADDCTFIPAANDNCPDRFEISDGDTPFCTINTNTDGVPNPEGLCTDFGSVDTYHDIWYNYTATCSGQLTVSTCEDTGGSADYDTDLVVYDVGSCDSANCPPSADDILGCNDDDTNNDCGNTVFHSTVIVPVTAGDCYKIRVGGWGAGDQGTGVLHIECKAPPSLIIKQGACPAPVNPNSNGVLPMLLVGTVSFDVNAVDQGSLLLRRCDGAGGSWAPLAQHTKVKDLNHPFGGSVDCGGCACNDDQSSDGIDDLSLKFRTSDTLAALGIVAGEGLVTVELTGNLLDGTPFSARDCIVVVPPGDGTSNSTFESTVFDTFIELTPLDLNVDSDGFANFSRAYIDGTNVTMTAPLTSEGRKFLRWSIDGVLQPFGLRTIEAAISGDMAFQAFYERPNRLVPDRPSEGDGDLE